MSKWVLLLGGSTGHGAATAKKLASEGYGIIAFHFDRGEAKKVANETIEEVKHISNNRCHYFNTNAASEKTMHEYIPKIKEITSCLLYTSPSPRDLSTSRMPSSA